MPLIASFLTRRFLTFAAVGASGALVHLAVLGLVYKMADAPFAAAQLLAVATAMTTNFLLNNEVTYRRHRLRGPSLVAGWLSFCGMSALGAAVNSAVTVALVHTGMPWWLAAPCGIAVAMGWNFRTTASITWRAAG